MKRGINQVSDEQPIRKNIKKFRDSKGVKEKNHKNVAANASIKHKQKPGTKNKTEKPKLNDKSRKINKFSKNKSDSKTAATPPDWAKFKKDKKQIRINRRQAGIDTDLLNVIESAKKINEKLRRKKMTADERLALTEELHKMLKQKGYYKQLAMAHDTSRIIQWLLKFGSEKIREEASMILVEMIVEMLQSKYARNSVKRILKYGNPIIRDAVLKSLNGNVVKLASHTISAPILDYAFTEVASKKQKHYLQQEFYGDIYKKNKDDKIEQLQDTYKNNPEMKNAILAATKANLLKVLNKNVHDCGLVHAILYEFLRECNSSDRSEIITTLCPLIAPLSNSKLGAKVATFCVWHGNAKDKKVILKVLKEHIVSLASHEHGHLLVLSILTAVDDTVLVNKVLMSLLLKDLKNLASTEWGRKIILWLVAPRNTTYFHPSFVKWLDTGLSEGTSKKPADVKASELLREALPPLCKSIEENTEFWMSSGSLCLTTVAIIKSASGENLKTCLDALSALICKESWEVEGINGIENAGVHMSLKKIIDSDKANYEKGEQTFGESLCSILNANIIKSWITTNRGCFLLVELYKHNNKDVQNKLILLLKPHSKILKNQNTKGAKILLGNLSISN